MVYKVEILDKNLNPVQLITNLAPLDKTGNILEFNSKLSNYGTARFRVGTKDPMLKTAYYLTPYQFHVRISRSGTVVWQGIILDNPHRTRNYIEVKAYTYLFLLSNYLVNRDVRTKYPGSQNYRQLDSGNMASSITAFINETKVNAANGALKNMTVGTIDNPNFPQGFMDFSGTLFPPNTPWAWSTTFNLRFDYRTVLYVIQQLGAYAIMDFEITNGLVFNFRNYIGNKQPTMNFVYSPYGGMIADYDSPLSGAKMANHLWAVAADISGSILVEDAHDGGSIATYGEIQGVAAFNDVKNASVLVSRANEQLRYSASPDSVLNVTLNSKAFPLGQWGLGDTVTFTIKDHAINYTQARRIVMIDVMVHNTGIETIKLASNLPRS